MVASTILLLACAPAPVEVSCDDFMRDKHLSKEIEVNVGDTFTVTLCSNPTTGFQWKYETIGKIVLQETDHEFVPPGGDIPGAAGKDIWTFEAVDSGQTELRMEYNQPWEGGEKGEWTYTLTVVVK